MPIGSQFGSASGSSGGGGTIGGSIAATQVAVGSGANTIAGSAALTFASDILSVGVAGSGNGEISLAGNTSGTATITAPAIAGTSTNLISISNCIGVPAGNASNPGFSFTGQSNTGFFLDSTAIGVSSNGNYVATFNSAALSLASSTVLGWVSGSLNAASDTGLSRISAGVIGIGTGAAGSAAGTLNAAGYQAGGTAGVTAGSFTAITAITSKAGIVTQLTGSSDERLKNSTPYTGGLNEILAITPASYYWNEKGVEHTGLSGKQQFVGFIAQDVQKAIPQAITATEQSKDGSETYLSLDDRPIIAALVNAVKELTARIKVLEAQG